MSNDDNENGGGYGKPPKKHQFKKGQSGNPKGRPPGRNSIEFSRLSEEALFQVVLDVAQESIGVTENGETINVPFIVALIKMMARESLNGNQKSRDQIMRLLEKSTKGKDRLINDVQTAFLDHQDRLLQASSNPGSYEHYHAKKAWFIVCKNLRQQEGVKSWPYEDDEPITDEDWVFFLQQCDRIKNKPHENLPWPPLYPSMAEERRFDNMTDKERIQDLYNRFKHRREMRAKEGPIQWPYMAEEPVDDRDWKIFELHVQDRLAGKDNPTQWPPEYWDEPDDGQLSLDF